MQHGPRRPSMIPHLHDARGVVCSRASSTHGVAGSRRAIKTSYPSSSQDGNLNHLFPARRITSAINNERTHHAFPSSPGKPLETLPTNPRDVAPVHDRMRCDAMQQRFHVDAELRLLVSSGSAAGFLTLPSAASSSRCCSGPCSCSWLLFSSPSGESARKGQMGHLQERRGRTT